MLLVYKQNLGLLIIFSPLAKWEHWHRTLCGLLKPTWRCKNSPSLLKPRVEPSIFWDLSVLKTKHPLCLVVEVTVSLAPLPQTLKEISKAVLFNILFSFWFQSLQCYYLRRWKNLVMTVNLPKNWGSFLSWIHLYSHLSLIQFQVTLVLGGYLPVCTKCRLCFQGFMGPRLLDNTQVCLCPWWQSTSILSFEILLCLYECMHGVEYGAMWKPDKGTRSLGGGVRLLLATMWVLRMEIGSSARAVSVLNHRIISPAPGSGQF